MSHIAWQNPGRGGLAGLAFVVAVAALASLAGSISPTVPQAQAADHLLLAEIQTLNNTATNRPLCSEFIELVNATDGDLPLGDVYLSDAIYSSQDEFYWRIAEGNPTSATAGGGEFSDFHARFPAGYVIAAGDTIVISLAGSTAYQAAYGRLPDLELYEDGLVPDRVPELREAFPGSIAAGLAGGSNSPSLTDGSESLILYTWDGSSDLVADVDFAFWGTSTSILFDKTDVTVGESTYLPDTPTTSQQRISSATLVFGQSYMRTGDGEGTETATGGNGVGGHNETSENLGTTWQVAAAQDPALQPATFFPSAPIITAGGSAPAAPYAGQEITLSLTAVSYSALSGVTFYVAYDRGPYNPVTGTSAGGGTYTATLSGQDEGTVVAWYAVATNADGASDTHPALGEAAALSFVVAAAPLPSDDPDKLLLTEICTQFTAQEFVEVYNPNATPVDLSDYYLTDAIYSTGNQYYWRIAEGNPTQATVGGGAFYDFHARFPAGFTIAAGDTIVVSIPGSTAFEGVFGFLPDLELFEDGDEADSVPDMRPVWVNGDYDSILGADSIPGLTNGGEIVVLYHWQEGDDLVTDIDVFSWKDPTSTTTSFFFDKTGVTIGTSTYQPDTPVGSQHPFSSQHSTSNSYQRIDLEEGDQLTSGSNGVDGRDETSEDFNATFTADLVVDPSRYKPENPLAPAITSAEVMPAKPSAGQAFTLLVTVESPSPVTAVEFYVQVAGGEFTLYPGVETQTGVYAANVPGEDYGTEIAWYAKAANEDGYTVYAPLGAPSATYGLVVGVDPYGLVIAPRTFIPTEGETFPLRFNGKAGSEVKLRIFDLEGRLVVTLFDSRFDGDYSAQPGKFTQVDWDGRDQFFERVSAGMYVAHLSVVDGRSSDEESWTAPVVVATRLSN